MQACLSAKKVQESHVPHSGGPVRACLRDTKDGECSFYHSGNLVKIVQACLSAGKVSHSHFNHCRGLVKFVQAHFSVRNDRESSFQRCGGAE